jgi:hypothetical protein
MVRLSSGIARSFSVLYSVLADKRKKILLPVVDNG